MDAKKTGKAVLRAADTGKAAGMCAYSTGANLTEVTIAAELPPGSQAVLQLGPEKGYRCLRPTLASEPLQTREQGVTAVWVLAGGKPICFARIGSGAFDPREATARLPAQDEHEDTLIKPASLPAEKLPPPHEPRPTPREPKETEVPFRADRDIDIGTKESATEPVLLLQAGYRHAAEEAKTKKAETAQKADTTVRAMAQPAATPQRVWKELPRPLVVKRAPRPTPRPPVYSPLWDDVSPEFEKMLENLPKEKPFNGNVETSEFASLPLDGAVQCYIGSVAVNGMKVFLQAVPARPNARPAGFDHTLVTRDGECYWVKYFLQEN